MNTVRVLLVDDEQHCLDVLEWELKNGKAPVEIVGSYTSPVMAIDAIKDLQPELVFLDIEMPEIDGIELVQSFDPIPFNVVFTTAFEHYALEAIKNQAIDYLLKPVNGEELQVAIERHQSKSIDVIQNQLNALFKSIQNHNHSSKKVVIPTADGLEFIGIDDIIRCESSSNYTYIHLRKQKKLLVSKTLKDIEAIIDSKMFNRVHKSHLVNLNAIRRYYKADGGYIVMEDDSQVPVARNKKSDFFNKLHE